MFTSRRLHGSMLGGEKEKESKIIDHQGNKTQYWAYECNITYLIPTILLYYLAIRR